MPYFSTESGYDKLTVGGTSYSGSAGPDGVSVSSSTSITWRSDSNGAKTGWKICLSAVGDFNAAVLCCALIFLYLRLHYS